MAKAIAKNTSSKLYFVHPIVDSIFIGGASMLTLVLLWAFYTPQRTETVIMIAAWLVWVCNWPHFSATSYRLYHSKENIRQYPFTAIVVPIIVGLGTLASFMFPATVAPYFVKVFLLWSPYHFSGQSVGVTCVYARRAGIVMTSWERMALSVFIFGTFLYSSLGVNVSGSSMPFYGVNVAPLPCPPWVAESVEVAMYAAGVALLGFVLRRVFVLKQRVPWIMLIPAIAQFCWFVIGSQIASFQEFVPFFHSLQYLLIAWSMQLKEKLDRTGQQGSKKYVFSETARWGVLNFVGGAILFYALPRLGSFASTTSLDFSTAIILSAVQIHHFFVDGVIWKLRRPNVTSPLMTHISEFTGSKKSLGVAA